MLPSLKRHDIPGCCLPVAAQDASPGGKLQDLLLAEMLNTLQQKVALGGTRAPCRMLYTTPYSM
jgi:hypothetical protein